MPPGGSPATKTGGGALRASLDAGAQREAEAIALRHAQAAGPHANVAILAIDARARAVRAYVGSAERSRPGGWIDMLGARRSPGSTLKPFVYAIAFDDGAASAETVITDAPQRFAGYAPENFDKRFYGDVRIREALQHSLNVPAVAVLHQIGARRFEAAISAAGAAPAYHAVKRDTDSGLALALGGAGLSARDLGRLYLSLARDGRASGFTLDETPPPAERRFISAEAAGAVRRLLTHAPSLEGRAPAAAAQSAPHIAFKTGTSYGYRDAWAAGVSDDWVVVVWIGRPDGAPRPGMTGRKAALPILFEMFDRLGGAQASETIADSAPAPGALARFNAARTPELDIIFPPDGAKLILTDYGPDSRGVAFAARAAQGPVRWYVDGAPTPEHQDRAVWRPQTPGFYRIDAVDETGAAASAQIRVVAAGGGR